MNQQFVTLHAFMALCLLLAAGALANWQSAGIFPEAGNADLLPAYYKWEAQNHFFRKAYISAAWLIANLITFFTVRRLRLSRLHYYLPLLASAAWYFLVRWLSIDMAWQGLFGELFGNSRAVLLISAVVALIMATLLYYRSLRVRRRPVLEKENILDSEL